MRRCADDEMQELEPARPRDGLEPLGVHRYEGISAADRIDDCEKSLQDR